MKLTCKTYIDNKFCCRDLRQTADSPFPFCHTEYESGLAHVVSTNMLVTIIITIPDAKNFVYTSRDCTG